MGTLEDRLNADVEGWRPEAGDYVLGTVVAVDTREGDYGPYPYVEIEKADGSIVGVHGFHTVLKNELARTKPEVGDTLGVKYFGKVATKPGSKYDSFEKYRVVHERTSGAREDKPDWGSMEADAKSELGGIADAFPGATEESRSSQP
jgi:hypothetical protein